jgi:hypothetical protein
MVHLFQLPKQFLPEIQYFCFGSLISIQYLFFFKKDNYIVVLEQLDVTIKI